MEVINVRDNRIFKVEYMRQMADIMDYEHTIELKDQVLAAKDAALAAKDAALAAKDAALAAKDAAIAEQNVALADKDIEIAELNASYPCWQNKRSRTPQ